MDLPPSADICWVVPLRVRIVKIAGRRGIEMAAVTREMGKHRRNRREG